MSEAATSIPRLATEGAGYPTLLSNRTYPNIVVAACTGNWRRQHERIIAFIIIRRQIRPQDAAESKAVGSSRNIHRTLALLSQRSYKIHIGFVGGSSWNAMRSLAVLSIETSRMPKMVVATSRQQCCTHTYMSLASLPLESWVGTATFEQSCTHKNMSTSSISRDFT